MIKILIPALDEADSIAKVVNDFLPYGEVVVCDNGSRDMTAKIAKNAGAKVLFEPRKGKGYAIQKLLGEIADFYVLVDGDDAFHAGDLGLMIRLLKENRFDMVIGNRVNLNIHNTNSIYLRKVFFGMLNSLFMFRCNTHLDFMSGYRCFNDNVKKRLSLKSNGFDIETDITLQTHKKGFNIGGIIVRVKPRNAGKQKSNIFNVGFPVLLRLLY